MKDRFSQLAGQYARYRPQYPDSLFEYITNPVPAINTAWDVGTGNGQVAGTLADTFGRVDATDISAQQIQHAIQKENIFYHVMPAEHTSFANETFDLITVAQAVHWFHFKSFYQEVERTLKPGGILAIWGYGLIKTNGALGDVLQNFYHSLNAYWDEERKHIDDEYAEIEFPYPIIPSTAFQINVRWTYNELIGYLSTWSAVKKYTDKYEENIIDGIGNTIKNYWGTHELRDFHFPVFLKMGKK